MFLAPLFLIGLLAAAVPLMLHLRRTARVKTVVFSTTKFFNEQFVQSARRARFQDVLIMLLRVSLITLFVLALAQPLLRMPGLSALTGDKRTVAIVIDDSASMASTGQDGSSLDKAKRGAMRVLDDLSPLRGDRVTIVLAGRRDAGVRVLFPEPTNDLDAVREAIQQITATDLAGDIPSAVNQARLLVGAPSVSPTIEAGEETPRTGGTSGAKEVYVFSDLQASGFGRDSVSGGLNTSVVFVSCVATNVVENLSVDAVQYGTTRPMVGVPFTFVALVTNHGYRERSCEARLLIGEHIVSTRAVSVLPGRSRLVRFVHRFGSPGWQSGRIEVTHNPADGSRPTIDTMTSDDQRFFSVYVEQSASILAVNGAPSTVQMKDELFFFRLGLSTVPDKQSEQASILVTTILPEQITPALLAPHAMVVLANVGSLAPSALDALEQYTDSGGSVLITSGDRVSPEIYQSWIGPKRMHGGLLPGRITRLIQPSLGTDLTRAKVGNLQDVHVEDAAGFIGSVTDTHPAMSGFADGRFGLLSSVTFRARLSLDAPPEAVLMRTAEGDPLLAEKRFGRGRVLFFTSSIDRDWTNFPLQPAYVPWLYRIVGYCIQPTIEGANFVPAGRVVHLPTSITTTESLQVILPSGVAVAATPSRGTMRGLTEMQGQASPLEFTMTERAGVYAVHAVGDSKDAAPRHLFCVNIPGEESEPLRYDKESLGSAVSSDTTWSFASSPDAAVEVGRVARQGMGFWDQLLIAALIVAVTEPWLANRLSRRRLQAEPDAMSRRDIAPTPRYSSERPAA